MFCIGLSVIVKKASLGGLSILDTPLKIRDRDEFRVATRRGNPDGSAVTAAFAPLAIVTLTAAGHAPDVDVLTDTALVNSGTHGGDLTGRVDTHNQWQLHCVGRVSGPGIHIESPVHGDGTDPNQNLALPGFRGGNLLVLHDIWASKFMHHNRLHKTYPFKNYLLKSTDALASRPY